MPYWGAVYWWLALLRPERSNTDRGSRTTCASRFRLIPVERRDLSEPNRDRTLKSEAWLLRLTPVRG